MTFQIGGYLARKASWRREDEPRWPGGSAALIDKPAVIRAAVAALDRAREKLKTGWTAWPLHQYEKQLEFGTGMQRVAALRAEEIQIGKDGDPPAIAQMIEPVFNSLGCPNKGRVGRFE